MPAAVPQRESISGVYEIFNSVGALLKIKSIFEIVAKWKTPLYKTFASVNFYTLDAIDRATIRRKA